MTARTGQIDRAIADYRCRFDREIRQARRDLAEVRRMAFEAIITSVYQGATRSWGKRRVTACFLDSVQDLKGVRSLLYLREKYEELEDKRDGYHRIRVELTCHLSKEGLWKLKRLKEVGFRGIHVASRTKDGRLVGFRFRATVGGT